MAPVLAGTHVVADGGQFGTNAHDGVYAVAADGTGTYLAGERGYLDEDPFGSAYVRQIRPDGTTGWKHHLKTGGEEYYLDVVTTPHAVYAVGSTSGVIADPDHGQRALYVAFVEKLRKSDGVRLWVRQVRGPSFQEGRAIAVDETGVYVGGYTGGALHGCLPAPCAYAGERDAFVRKYDADGVQLWTKQYGTDLYDTVDALAAQSGGVFVGGATGGVLEAGHVMTGGIEAYIRPLTRNGSTSWTLQFGPVDGVTLDVGQLAANANGVYVAGGTQARLDGTIYEHKGLSDVYVRMYSLAGTLRDTQQFGTAGNDGAHGLATRNDGVFVAGGTDGDLFRSSLGGYDAWARRFSSAATGPLLPTWQLQFGTAGDDVALGLDTVMRGTYLAGETNGAIAGCSPACQSHSGFDSFWVVID